MRVTAALSLLLLALLSGAGSARAGTDLLIGVHDDTIKWTEQPAPILDTMQALGLGGMRMTLEWRPGKRHLPVRSTMHSAARSPHTSTACGSCSASSAAPPTHRAPPRVERTTAASSATSCVRYGEIRDVVIWNEANSDTFWQPQEGAPADYAALLARCWDVLHASFPAVNVLTTTASSHEPAAFIRGIGAAYRPSGRALPLSTASATTRIRSFRASRRPPATTSTSDRETTTAWCESSTSPSPARRNRPRRSGTSRTASRRRSRTDAAPTTPARRTSRARSRRPSRRRSWRPRSGSRAASRAWPRTSTSSSSTRRCSRAGSPACCGPTGSASRRSPPTARRSPRSGAAPSTAPLSCGR